MLGANLRTIPRTVLRARAHGEMLKNRRCAQVHFRSRLRTPATRNRAARLTRAMLPPRLHSPCRLNSRRLTPSLLGMAPRVGASRAVSRLESTPVAQAPMRTKKDRAKRCARQVHTPSRMREKADSPIARTLRRCVVSIRDVVSLRHAVSIRDTSRCHSSAWLLDVAPRRGTPRTAQGSKIGAHLRESVCKAQARGVRTPLADIATKGREHARLRLDAPSQFAMPYQFAVRVRTAPRHGSSTRRLRALAHTRPHALRAPPRHNVRFSACRTQCADMPQIASQAPCSGA